MILGLTGSLGSGKTYVSSLLRLCGAPVICADLLAREVVAPGTTALHQITTAFGSDVIQADGSLDRPRLAARVFNDPQLRKSLEEIIHPRVRARELQLLEELKGCPLRIVDVPLLFETGFDVYCDKIAVVIVTDEARKQRLRHFRAMTDEEITSRLASQMPQEEKARRASFLIDNSGSKAHTLHQVNRMLATLFPEGLPEPLHEIPATAAEGSTR